MRRLFIGPDGLRVGWRLLLFFIFFGVLGTALQYIVMKMPVLGAAMKLAHTGAITPLGLFGYELANIVSVFVAMGAMAKIEKRRLGDYGLRPRTGAAKRLALGFAFGLLMVAAICALQGAEHVYSFGSLVMTPGAAVKAGFGWAVAFLLVGVAEESVFRGYAQFTLTQATGFWPAAIAISLLFGVTHISNTNYKAAGIMSAGLLGLFSAFCLRRTGDLWLPIGIHAAFDYAEFFIFFAPSGGHESSAHLLGATRNGPGWLTGSTIGPEASVNGYVVLAIAFVVVAALCKKTTPERFER
jgi:membrane protease YdiL (CAAX protease family)